MEFDFTVRGLGGPDNISIWDAPAISKLSRDELANLATVVNRLGKLSQIAQALPAAITDITRLRSTDQRLYMYAQRSAQGTVVLGGIKVGTKQLFVMNPETELVEIKPMCVLDFYVHESVQRQGVGKQLFECMLATERTQPAVLAYDRPSPKLIAFCAKHYRLTRFTPQNNNYVVFHDYFDVKGHGGDRRRRGAPSRPASRSCAAPLGHAPRHNYGAPPPLSAPRYNNNNNGGGEGGGGGGGEPPASQRYNGGGGEPSASQRSNNGGGGEEPSASQRYNGGGGGEPPASQRFNNGGGSGPSSASPRYNGGGGGEPSASQRYNNGGAPEPRRSYAPPSPLQVASPTGRGGTPSPLNVFSPQRGAQGGGWGPGGGGAPSQLLPSQGGTAGTYAYSGTGMRTNFSVALPPVGAPGSARPPPGAYGPSRGGGPGSGSTRPVQQFSTNGGGMQPPSSWGAGGGPNEPSDARPSSSHSPCGMPGYYINVNPDGSVVGPAPPAAGFTGPPGTYTAPFLAGGTRGGLYGGTRLASPRTGAAAYGGSRTSAGGQSSGSQWGGPGGGGSASMPNMMPQGSCLPGLPQAMPYPDAVGGGLRAGSSGSSRQRGAAAAATPLTGRAVAARQRSGAGAAGALSW